MLDILKLVAKAKKGAYNGDNNSNLRYWFLLAYWLCHTIIAFSLALEPSPYTIGGHQHILKCYLRLSQKNLVLKLWSLDIVMWILLIDLDLMELWCINSLNTQLVASTVWAALVYILPSHFSDFFPKVQHLFKREKNLQEKTELWSRLEFPKKKKKKSLLVYHWKF